MSKKTGRNDPCPCGSGKKYKKCCGADLSEGGFVQTPEDWFPPSERTGTLWDEYMDLIPIFAIYGKKIMQFEKDGKAFEKAVSDFEKHFCPGEQDG
ncbi:MAG: SEC-C metal-binding domain-containing protein, partial [Pseudomonadota bacterium]